uniref:tRNA-dihydrouridine(16/17) synthase [NAD(P)(+)] n=1 Tax=Ditylum brightwellii TaxID=49249 RepID=A0A7S2E9D4_9STRA|mmetsp:Transcript_19971/g.29775  ORF Transcript_19971/g.29775 Transcript_19971/m.29775 type:complete len:447 (+) Transcript_19971:145-1485(+)
MAPSDDLNDAIGASAEGSTREKVDRNWLRNLLRRHHDQYQEQRRMSTSTSDEEKEDDILKDKALIVAPMVDQSDLPFRLLCRKHGANLAFTPMIHARLFITKEAYKKKFWDFIHGTPKEDRPLIAQFCGDDPNVLLEAAKSIEHHVDGVDLNCGCPQGIARRGNYGAYLLEQADTLVNIVKTLSASLTIPVTVKVRLLPTGEARVEDSIRLYHRLVDAGAHMITVHGRTRLQKGRDTGKADWDAIRQVVEAIGDRVPVIANGGIENFDDVKACLRQTKADGVMSSESILEYPPLFTNSHTESTSRQRTGPGRIELSRDYIQYAKINPPNKGGQGSGLKCIRVHIHRFLHADLQSTPNIRDLVCTAQSVEELEQAIDLMEKIHNDAGHVVREEQKSWYVRHRVVGEDGLSAQDRKFRKDSIMTCDEPEDDSAICVAAMFGNDDNGDY